MVFRKMKQRKAKEHEIIRVYESEHKRLQNSNKLLQRELTYLTDELMRKISTIIMLQDTVARLNKDLSELQTMLTQLNKGDNE